LTYPYHYNFFLAGIESDGSVEEFRLPKKRLAKSTSQRPPKKAKTDSQELKVPKCKRKVNSGGKSTFTVDSVLESFKDTTEYGASFRSMTSEIQAMEVVRLNKGAATGMKGAIRKQRIDVQFKTLVSERMKEFLIQNRTQPQNMFRTVAPPRLLQKLQLRFLSIGEWVEVDADRTPGWNSEGGIAVIVNVNDGLADVKYEPSLEC
jgi:hypothetical protein